MSSLERRINKLSFRVLLITKRKNLGITQKQLADKLGVSSTVISQYERGIRNPKIETIRRITEELESIEQSLIVKSSSGNTIRYCCAECGNEAKLYKFHGEQLCINCITELLPVVEGSE